MKTIVTYFIKIVIYFHSVFNNYFHQIVLKILNFLFIFKYRKLVLNYMTKQNKILKKQKKGYITFSI